MAADPHNVEKFFADQAKAKDDIAALKRLTTQIGVEFVDRGEIGGLGHGFVIRSDTGFVAVSVLQSQMSPYITAGVLRDVVQDELLVLRTCNRTVQESPQIPVFLHRAEVGWDLLAQVAIPLRILQADPDYYVQTLRGVIFAAGRYRELFAEAGVRGATYEWEEAHFNRLLNMSIF